MTTANHHIILWAGFVLILLLIVFMGADAHAATSATDDTQILSRIATEFHAKAGKWEGLLTEHAKVLFRILLILDVCFLGIRVATKQTEVDEALAEFIMLILYAGLMFAILIYYKEWTNQIIIGLSKTAQELGAPPVTAGSIFLAGVQVFDTMLASMSWDIAKSAGLVLVAIAICISFSMIAAQVILVKCEAYIVLNAGIILLGFSGSKITRDYAINFIKYAFSVAMKLFTMQLLISLSIDFINGFHKPEINFAEVLVILGASIVILALTMSIPDIISGLINGPLSSSGRYLTSAVTAVSSSTSTVVKGATSGMIEAKRGTDAVREASSYANTAGKTGFGKLGHMAATGINSIRENLSQSRAGGIRSSTKTQHEAYKMQFPPDSSD
ncbi:P-type conjugative transfer protein TrbL [Desulfovibrio sp. JC022]|uniref:P-type conjugative transfer protein TrbL n=1 Tax=Desulfovibrio sp. JC022 TaxID=2593642 RepID=UPI0013CF4F37|nr:P-type conjugative transfer protein TrbL [Desulfovibrio sp. JC022]NDV24842.1 P-type conjugative transfer protein TrbL [Desulfovibrio sp. JC022]